MADCTFLPWSMYTWVLQKRNTYMFLCKNMCFHLLCVTMINNCPRNLSISEFCNWEQRVQDASTHTQVVGQAIQYLSFSCRFSEARMLLESDLEFWSKTVPMLLEGSSNSARMFLQLFSNVPPIILECSSNYSRMFLQFCSNAARMLCEVQTATELNLQNRNTSKQEPVDAIRKISSSCRISERLGLGFFCISCFRRRCLRRPIL
jgi:hypothetical protein